MARQIVVGLRQSRKYRDLCDETLYRMADWALARHSGPKAAGKAARRKLHQVYGAFAGLVDAGQIDRVLDGLTVVNPEPACESILREHLSTVERQAIVAEVFPALWEQIGRPSSVMDLACGLNPFAWPWMDLSGVTYYACDIDMRLVAYVRRFLALMGVPGRVECRDLLVSTPDFQADVALLLKTMPCLEQQEKGACIRLLKTVCATHFVVSFPAHSIGGRDKGMADHYDGVIRQMAEVVGRRVQRLAFSGEIFYVLTHPPSVE